MREWRRGKELNQPDPGTLSLNGFEDRGGHQAPISLPVFLTRELLHGGGGSG